MTYANRNILQPPDRAAIMQHRVAPALLTLLCLAAQPAMSQDKEATPKQDDLDVTMQIITDPDAKRPDEVVRQIPLPPRKPPASAANNAADAANKGQEQAREAKELAREAKERAKERAKEAAEQREQASRSMAKENRRNPDPPGPPPRPPRP
jgi:hypothetical protein